MKFFKKYKSELLLGSGAVLAGILSFFITIAVYPEVKGDQIGNNQVADQTTGLQDEIPNEFVWVEEPNVINNEENNMEAEILISDIGDSITFENEEIIPTQQEETNEVIEVINQESDVIEEENLLIEEFENLTPEKVREDIKNLEETIEAISNNTVSYDYPISGDIILEFAKDKLVFSETLNEWITHDGIDIKGKVAEPVKAAADGIIESMKMDPRYGNTIIINHDDEYKTVYSNLSTLELVYVGKVVKKGDIISGVGEGFGFESEEGPHVHFEIIKDGECENPVNG